MKNIIIEISKEHEIFCKYAITKLIKIKYIDNDYDLKIIDRHGKYIKVISNKNIEYICISNESIKKARNTYIFQNLVPTIKQYLKDNNSMKNISVLYLDNETYTKSKYIYFSDKIIKSLGIKTINNRFIDNKSFKNVNEIQIFRQKSKKSNNLPTTIFNYKNEIYLYCRLDGTNTNEVFLILMLLKKWNDKCKLIQIFKDKKNIMNEKNVINNFIKYFNNINYNQNEIKKCNKKTNYIFENNIKTRNQSVFIRNLFIKFGNKRCFICDCDIWEIVDGSHILGINEFNENKEKFNNIKNEINSGDNGIWLCKNHHKLYDTNNIKFNECNTKLIINEKVRNWKNNNINYDIFKSNYEKYISNTNAINFIKARNNLI